MGSQKYTSDCTYSQLTIQHLSQRDAKACIPERNKSASTGQQTEGDGLLHSGICYKQRVSHVFLKRQKEVQIIGPYTDIQTCKWLQHYGWQPLDHPPCSPDPTSSYFHAFVFLKKHLAGKRFVTDTEVKLAVTYCLQTFDISLTPE